MKQPQWRLEACGLYTAVAGKRSDELACMLANAWVTGLDLEKIAWLNVIVVVSVLLNAYVFTCKAT